MQIVILGQKKQKNGRTIYRTYQNHKYESTPKEPLVIGQTIKTLVSPFPFEVFSSLDFEYEAESFKMYDPCYLLVDANLTQGQLNQMSSGNKRSYVFRNCEITFLAEFHKPFQYALDQYYKYPKLGTWNLVTWMPHQEIRSDDEFKAMSKIFDIDYDNTVAKGYKQSISFDKWIIPYLPQLVDKPDLAFGDGGYFKKDMATLCAIDTLPVDKLVAFVHKYVYDVNKLIPFWLKHPLLGEAWFWDQLADTNSVVSQKLLRDNYEAYDASHHINWYRLFDWRYNTLQAHDKRDLKAFFNSPFIEKEYQRQDAEYQAYVDEQNRFRHDDEDDDDSYWDDPWDDDFDYDDLNAVHPPYDKRVLYLKKYCMPFKSVLTLADFKAKFPMVPAMVWERYDSEV